MSKIEINLITGDDGTVDVAATLEQAENDIATYKAERETEETTIQEKLDEVFNSHPNVKMNKPYVVGQVLTLMGISQAPGSYTTLLKRVNDYITANSQGKTDKVTKLVERPDSYFVIGRGKGQGLARRADLDAIEAAKLANDSE